MNGKSKQNVAKLRKAIENINPGYAINLMEVCGTHTMTIARSGIRDMLPQNVRLLSGPGCPVCVTSAGDIDKAIEYSKIPGAVLATFGDMIRVPGSRYSLSQARARGSDVRVVYSVYEALKIAESNPDRSVIFESIGFETTAPSVADAIIRAKENGIDNFYVLCLNKTVPRVLRVLSSSDEVRINGFILPGHVSAIIGVRPYRFLASEYGINGIISGFDTEDVLLTIAGLLKHIRDGEAVIENQYSRVVREDGNTAALSLLYGVFEPCDTAWRGIGTIPGSGLKIKDEYGSYDAEKRFGISVTDTHEPRGCRCGDVLRGIIDPQDCPLFGKSCTPDRPVGPCMVSSEGSCGIWYRERKAL